MKKLLGLSLSIIGCCYSQQDMVLSATTLDSGTTPYQASNSITNSATFVVQTAASVTFRAGSYIRLESGFRATAGSAPITFYAVIDDPNNQSTSGVSPTAGALVPQPPDTSAAPITPPPPISASTVNCNDISGNWFDSASNAFVLNQTGSAVSGYTNQYDSACGTVQWTITGQATGPNTFTLTESNPTPAVDSCGRGVEQQETAKVVINSCQQAQEFFVSGSSSASRFANLGSATAQSTSGNSWNRPSEPPKLDVKFDIMQGTVTTTVSGQNETDNLSVTLQDWNGNTTTLATHSNVGSKSFPDPLKRPSLPIGIYGTVTARWGNITTTISPPPFDVLGVTRLTQYNTPYESQCKLTSTSAARAFIYYNIDSTSCYWQAVPLNTAFMQQVFSTGPGSSLMAVPSLSLTMLARKMCVICLPAQHRKTRSSQSM
jgi:hypothetical protein